LKGKVHLTGDCLSACPSEEPVHEAVGASPCYRVVKGNAHIRAGPRVFTNLRI
jgi:hypothetical protein